MMTRRRPRAATVLPRLADALGDAAEPFDERLLLLVEARGGLLLRLPGLREYVPEGTGVAAEQLRELGRHLAGRVPRPAVRGLPPAVPAA